MKNKTIIQNVLFIISSLLICSPVYANETIVGWKSDLYLPNRLANTSSIKYQDKIYIFGGSTNLTYNDVLTYSAYPGSLNFLDNYSNNLSDSPYYTSAISTNDQVFVLGGTHWENAKTISVNNVRKALIDAVGRINTWVYVQPLPKNLSLTGSTIVGDKIYVSGGFTWTDGGTPAGPWSEIYMAKISDLDGVKTDVWTIAGYIPEARGSHTMLNINGKLFIVAGAKDNSFEGSNSVFIGTLKNTGEIDHWNNGIPVPASLHYPIVNYDKGYLYVAGGYNGSFQNQVYYTKIYSDGQMDNWTTSSHPLPENDCCTSSVIQNGTWYIFGGNYGNYYDKIFYTDLVPSGPTPTPASTPPPVKRPVVLIPGIGSCWNYDALIHGAAKENKDWTLGIYATPYTRILKTLTNSGYKEKDDLFIYCYDWRKNIKENISQLDQKIEEILHDKPFVTGVDIIGHSMGGLIGSEYTSQHNQKVNKLVTAGTPFWGSTKAYKLWEGADFSDYQGLEKIAMSLLMRANMKKYPNDAIELREMVPSIQDLLPIYDYLKTNQVTIKPWNSLLWYNEYLPNVSLANIKAKVYPISGIDIDTAEYYQVGTRNTEEFRLGKWTDGKPIATDYGKGDGTVLRRSSYLDGANNVTLTGVDHFGTISSPTAQEQILKLLGINGNVSGDTIPKVRKSLVVTIESPVTFEIKNEKGKIIEQQDNLAYLDDPDTGIYSVTVNSFASGRYTLLVGRINDNNEVWDEINGNFDNPGDSRIYDFYVDMNAKYLGADPVKNVHTELKWLISQIEVSKMNSISKKFWIQKLQQLNHAIDVQPIPTGNILNMIENFLYNKEDIGFWTKDDPAMLNEIMYGLRIIRIWLQQ